jgi:hypothetical protein
VLHSCTWYRQRMLASMLCHCTCAQLGGAAWQHCGTYWLAAYLSAQTRCLVCLTAALLCTVQGQCIQLQHGLLLLLIMYGGIVESGYFHR